MTDYKGERGEKGDQGQHGQDGAQGKPGVASRRGLIGYLILSAFVVIAFYVGFLNRTNVAEQALQNCREIEGLKTLVRQDAIENYKNLPKNAKLLGIPLTDELKKEALESRNRRLFNYRRLACPRTVEDLSSLP